MGSEDQFRHYFPLMRRVIILVAVLTAVPVILWTITVFVRGYFGPPKIAAPRPLATVSAEAPVPPAASQDASARTPAASQQAKLVDAPPVVEARATVTDARTMPPAAKWPVPGDRQSGSDAGPPSSAPNAAAMAPAAPAGADQRAAQAPASQATAAQKSGAQAMAAAPAMPTGAIPTGAADSSGTLAAQDSADADQEQTAETALPAAQPIAGPVPLPRHRPRSFAMLTSAVPMPRPRPEAAGAAGSEGDANPLGWLQKLFTPQQQ